MTTIPEMLKCAERELALRKSVYPGLIRRKKMSVTKADYELKCQEHICDHFRELAAAQLGLPAGA